MTHHIRFINCARKLYCEPWCILPAMHARLCEIFEAHRTGTPQAGMFDAPGKAEDPRAYEVNDGVAIIPISGVISKEISSMERMSGAVDVDDIGAMLAGAVDRADVDAIVMRVNSPGGSVAGVPELAELVSVAAQAKPVVAYADGLMASAAYYIAAGATTISAGKSAEVGSIGVYLALLDESAAYAMAGYKREIIKSADTPHKAAGYPGTSLTDEQRAELQARVDYLYAEFRGHVAGSRVAVADNAMQGQTFIGQQAVAAGLVDSITTFRRAIADAKLIARTSN